MEALQKKTTNLDSTLAELGTLGRYQVLHYFLLAVITLLSTSAYLSYIFTTGQLDYRCKIPTCDRSNDSTFEYSPDWLKIAVPFEENGKPATCQRFRYLANDHGLSCDEFSFNRSLVENCDEFVFAPGELTIVNEFNITCPDKEWQLALVGSLGFMAEMIVLPVSAFLSDKYGRRPVLISGLLLTGVCGLIKSISVDYVMFATMEFLTAFVSGGTYMTTFIMAIESAAPSHRVLSGTIITLMFSISQALTGLIAMWEPDFRTLLQLLYIPNMMVLTFVWMVPESIRWLVTNGQTEKAEQIITNAANMNNIKMSVDVLEYLANTSDWSENNGHYDTENEKETFLAVLRSRLLCIRLVVNIVIWFLVKLIYFGMTVQSVSLMGNKYINYIVVSVVDLPAIIISCLLMNSWGRKRSLLVTLLLTAVACVGTHLIPDSAWLASLLVYIFGKCCVTTAFSIIYVYSSEMFPTTLRHSTMNACYSIGTLGASFAPFTMLLVSTWPTLTLIIFGASALFCGTLVFLLPETLNTRLPDTIAEAEKFTNHYGSSSQTDFK